MKRIFYLTLCLLAALAGDAAAMNLNFTYIFTEKPSRAKVFFESKLQIDFADAIAAGNTNKMQKLIAAGADVNATGKHGMKPIFWAMAKGNIKAFSFLLDNGADANATAKRGTPPYNTVTIAASMNDSEFLKELLTHGASPNYVAGGGETPVFFALFERLPDNVEILLKHGADINWKDAGGYTPLNQAVNYTSFRIALQLLRSGADVQIKNKWGYSVIDNLKENKNRGVLTKDDAMAYEELIAELIKRGHLDAKP